MAPVSSTHVTGVTINVIPDSECKKRCNLHVCISGNNLCAPETCGCFVDISYAVTACYLVQHGRGFFWLLVISVCVLSVLTLLIG